MSAIDTHSHYIPAGLVGRKDFPIKLVSESPDGSTVNLEIFGRPVGPVPRGMIDLGYQLVEMDSKGLQVKFLNVPPFLFLYELPPEQGRQLASAVNEEIARESARSGGKFVPVATLPLQDVPASVVELERCVTGLGMKAVTIATNINGVDFDDPSLRPFFDAAAKLGVPIILHPHYVYASPRGASYHLRNLVGNPMETSLAAGRLVFSGIMDELPDLKIVLPHGGGAVPYLAGRFDQGFRGRPECRRPASAPSKVLRRFYYDTIAFDPLTLRFLLEFAGPDHVLLGTDYPFDMADETPVETVQTLGLAAEVEVRVMEGNARRLFRL